MTSFLWTKKKLKLELKRFENINKLQSSLNMGPEGLGMGDSNVKRDNFKSLDTHNDIL